MRTEEEIKEKLAELEATAKGVQSFIDDCKGNTVFQSTRTYSEAIAELVILTRKINMLKWVLND